jgi:hypothetical protein
MLIGMCVVEPLYAKKANILDYDESVISCVGDSLTVGEGCSKLKHLNLYPGLLGQNPLFADYVCIDISCETFLLEDTLFFRISKWWGCRGFNRQGWTYFLVV